MNIISNTITVYTLELTDQDVADILVDPAPFQAKLRTARNGVLAPLQKRKSGYVRQGGVTTSPAQKRASSTAAATRRESSRNPSRARSAANSSARSGSSGI